MNLFVRFCGPIFLILSYLSILAFYHPLTVNVNNVNSELVTWSLMSFQVMEILLNFKEFESYLMVFLYFDFIEFTLIVEKWIGPEYCDKREKKIEKISQNALYLRSYNTWPYVRTCFSKTAKPRCSCKGDAKKHTSFFLWLLNTIECNKKYFHFFIALYSKAYFMYISEDNQWQYFIITVELK